MLRQSCSSTARYRSSPAPLPLRLLCFRVLLPALRGLRTWLLLIAAPTYRSIHKHSQNRIRAHRETHRIVKTAISRREDERCAHLLRRSFCFAAFLISCFAVLVRLLFLSPARPSVLSSGLHMRDIVKCSTAAAYRSDEPHVSGAMSNKRFFDIMTRGGTAQLKLRVNSVQRRARTAAPNLRTRGHAVHKNEGE